MARDTLPSDEDLSLRPSIIVAAHPDDEVVGLGTRLNEFQNLLAIVHVTDGAPRTGPDVANAGFATWRQYADQRRKEFESAMREARARPGRKLCFWCPDQRAIYGIASHTRRLAALFERVHPQYVFTHPYEGGHPDHDAAAVSVHAAVALLRNAGRAAPLILEFASYHNSCTGLESERFLDDSEAPVRDRVLNSEQQNLKQNVFRCYASQQKVLAWFPIKREPVRLAPAYDFTSPPHEGQLLYETFGLGLTGKHWRRVAAKTLRNMHRGLTL